MTEPLLIATSCWPWCSRSNGSIAAGRRRQAQPVGAIVAACLTATRPGQSARCSLRAFAALLRRGGSCGSLRRLHRLALYPAVALVLFSMHSDGRQVTGRAVRFLRAGEPGARGRRACPFTGGRTAFTCCPGKHGCGPPMTRRDARVRVVRRPAASPAARARAGRSGGAALVRVLSGPSAADRYGLPLVTPFGDHRGRHLDAAGAAAPRRSCASSAGCSRTRCRAANRRSSRITARGGQSAGPAR